MSRSPANPQAGATVADRRSAFRRYLAQLDRKLEDGESWSGNERNCAFLNLGTRESPDVRFATISAVSGLNFLDDGRAHAVVDWDQDGDVDIWSTNRTAPRLRLMRNDADRHHHFLALRLVGRRCNRDAIGARVEIRLAGEPARRPLTRTLRAGEGFLAQSTKWLHFGLGDQAAIDEVRVHWPGGESQSVRGVEADAFFVITQDDASAERFSAPPRGGSRLNPAAMAAPESSDAAQILLSSRLPLPRIPIQRFDGSGDQLERFQGQSVWLTLWASWCVPCVAELQQVTARADELRRAGLNVVALSLDDFDQPGTEATTREDARALMDRLAFPFESVIATPETIRRLQFADQQVFGRQTELALPTSYLLTPAGQLAAIYRGPVSIDRVLADAAHQADDARTLLQAALPFPGIWFDGRRRYAPLAIVADLLDHRAVEDALQYLQENRADLARQPGYPEVVGVLGTALAGQQRIQTALEVYRWALEVDPRNVAVLNNLAWHLATHEDPTVQDPQEAIRYAQQAARLTQERSAPILDTLATAYAAADQRDQARATWDRAIQLAQQQGQTELAARLQAKRAEP